MKLYRRNRDILQTGDFLQWSSDTALGWIIQKITKSKWNHTGLIVRFEQYDIERVFTLEALETGVTLNPLSTRIREHKGECAVFPLQDRFDLSRDRMGSYMLRCVGIRYDFFSLIKQAVSRVSTDVERLFCSEFAGLVANRSGIPIPLKPAPRPSDIPDFKVFDHPIYLKRKKEFDE